MISVEDLILSAGPAVQRTPRKALSHRARPHHGGDLTSWPVADRPRRAERR